jgi:DNA-binding LytR/AlgR family response regulator
MESFDRTRWGGLQVILADGSKLRVSRTYQAALRELAKT